MPPIDRDHPIGAGFIEPFIKELPMDYAVEVYRLIELQMEGSMASTPASPLPSMRRL